MNIKTKFALSTLVLAIAALALCTLGIRWYSSHFPRLASAFPSIVSAIAEYKSSSAYDNLVPTTNEPNGVYYRDNVLVLMYHDVSPNPENDKSLPLASFDKQLELMKANNFHWITMEQYRDFILHSAPVPDNAVLLTFDDGYESLYDQAYPSLKKYGAPASAFLIVKTVGDPSDPFPRVTWDQVREMHQNGIDFFNHTYDSHRYAPTEASGGKPMSMIARRLYLKDKQRQETEEEYETRVTADLRKANEILEREIGIRNYAFAFPYGAFSDSLLNISGKLGMDITFTVKSGLNAPGQTNGFRLNAGGEDNNPDLQIALMKQAETRLADHEFKQPQTRQYAFLALSVLFVLTGIFWLWTGWRLIRSKKRVAA
ncbi:polysaccharide deacetylase family protein [Cohnella terricola]|nr:polysaccharide deacetylase family protein [Cohnella terricola]